MGITHNNLSRLERGTVRKLSPLFLTNCRAELGLSIDWLVTGQEPMFLAEAELQASLPSELPRQKGKKRRPGFVSISADQKELQRKHHQLTASLARATRLAQELSAQATDQDARAKKK